ncbi:hypothetical protein M758_4G132600 [Ceratodon purpureus]|nr:hypothetical protein M758_4G132600 [Ceratodon purpureus]
MDDTRMHVVNNIFLPRKLPQSDFPSEGEFVREFAQVLAEDVTYFPALKEAERMMKAWSWVQRASVNWEFVHESINRLQPGETFSLYLRAQNAGITISLKDEPVSKLPSATLAVFRVAASASKVMQAKGDLSDVFPSWAVTTDAERVRNEVFAKQVADLANTGFVEMLPKSKKAGKGVPETRDVVDPSYVTRWLLLAVAGESIITGETGVARVRNKIRDDVLWNDTELPWRRSGEYMTVKIVLQSTLVGKLGEQHGLISYKYILIQVMTRILRQNYKNLETDVVLQMLSKFARRLSKLRNLMDRGSSGPGPTIWQEIHSRVQEVLQRCSEIVVDIRAFIDMRWRRIVEDKERQFKVPVDTSKLSFAKHITHSLVNAQQHLQLALDSTSQPNPIKVNDPICSNRNKGSSLKMDFLVNNKSSGLDHHENLVNMGEALYDIEVWVQKVLWPARLRYVKKLSPETVFELLRSYLNLSKMYYKDDALGSSRMVITTITLVAILDFKATCEHPLLLTYHHGVNVGVLQSLLLAHRADMEHLTTLEAYFATRSKGESPSLAKISLISEDQPSPRSFSVSLVDSDDNLQRIKDEILEFDAAQERGKLMEVSRQRKIYDGLLDTIREASHEYGNDSYGYKSVHASWCWKCQMETRAKGMKVEIYEHPLPKEGYLQNAVVYELATPTELSVLRDALHILNRDLLGVQLGSMEKRGTWLNYKPLEDWVDQKYKKLTTLCSTSKLFSVSHYSSLHISASDEDFIKPNGYNVHLLEAGGNHSASTACYKEGANTSFLTLTVNGDYKCLQWTITSTTHDENQVLARQMQCPPKLNLAEFKAFGALRAGHRLQIRNISHVLEMQTLSLFQPSVVNLFSQALWQTGPLTSSLESCSNKWVRESHLDLQEQPFAEYMICQLQILLERNKENWKDHLGLLSIVIIGARILALSEDAWQEAASGILLSCRAIAESWLEKIEQVLGEMSASSIQKIQEIRSKLFVLRKEGDVTSWLRTVARICDNTLLNSGDSCSSETFAGLFQRNLLRRVQNTALHLEDAVNNWVTNSESCLSNFVSKHWADADQGQIGFWERYTSPCERWWKATFEHKSGRKMTLQMDILRGSFLVDGCPVARLPTTITSHQDYGRVFGKHVFQVQPAAGSPGSFVTCYKLNGSKFTFALVDGNRLLVTERQNGGCELQLFPNRFFKGDLPKLLIEEHSHWILKASKQNTEPFKHMDPDETLGCILFRPVKFDDIGFADIEGVPFVFNITSRYVRDTMTDRHLVDVRSQSFKELHSRMLHRLELPQFVHVFDNKDDDTVAAELPRMGLRFIVDPKAGIFWSCEHPGFSVSENQNINTLIGLRNGLLLEEHDVPDQCTRKHHLIIPHTRGLLKREMEGIGTLDQHPVVGIDLTEFSSPSFFVFEVDHRLQNLRGPASGPTAWLYLALLHASTSHVLPDPFTGLTGTESAMRLLQSPRCWSCMPYKHEATSILQAIAKLSPRREWYPEHLKCMQQVQWPEALFSSTALDAFRLVVKKLMSDSERLRFLFSSSNEVPVLPQADMTLLLKYYWRSREAFGKEAQMDSAMERHWGGLPATLSTSMNLGREEYVRFQRHTYLRSLAEAGHKWRNLALAEGKNSLSVLLLQCQKLKGASGREKTLRDSTVSTWRTLANEKLHDIFLDLYNLARETTHFSRGRETLTLLLSVLAYLSNDPSIHIILSILHCVAIHAVEFKAIIPPRYDTFEDTDQTEFDMDMVTGVVKDNLVSFYTWMSEHGGKPYYKESSDDFHSRVRKTFEEAQAQSIKTMTQNAQRCWPSDVSAFGYATSTIQYHLATQSINELFTRWRRNKELHNFVVNVEKKVLNLCYQPGVTVRPAPLQATINFPTSATIQPFHSEMPVSSLSSRTRAETNNIFGTGRFGTGIRRFGTGISAHRATENRRPETPPFPLQPNATMSSCEIARKFNIDLETSWLEHHKIPPQSSRIVVKELLEERLKSLKQRSKSLWTEICAAVQPCSDDPLSKALAAASLWRRALPIVLLPCIISDENSTVDKDLSKVREALGALAVIWTLEQQAERCLRMLKLTKSPREDVALQKEMANAGHVNWQPKDRPKWLLLELEGDYFMRAIQVDVANQMLFPPDSENVVLQLNMGEGKTSVIVPALCAHIPDGKRFARLTVLGSLFRMNFDALVSKLGGLLNQRVYTFPFRRDISIDARGVHTMHDVYQECISKHGVVVMRPEQRLSTILKGLELCRLGATSATLAAEMRDLQDMVEKNARDILDESDLLLHVKYQVVYTVGEQMNLDGGDLRWKVSQSVLRSAQHHCSALLEKYGNEKMELKAATEGPYAFPHIRILDASISSELCEKIAEDMLRGGDDNLPIRELRRKDADLIRSFILPPPERPTDIVSVDSIQRIYNQGPILETILILRGLLCYGVLVHALQMRWRVQYGVRPSGKPKMAVPFRAKDVPVERAEFGHPDLAIMLTQLSYYHGGLSDEQLLDAFDKLHRSSTSESEYQRWLLDVPLTTLPQTLRTLSGVNLDDFVQRTEVLFPILRRNMQVINFWLSTAVFPIESKMFEGKLVASAWDLSDHSKGGHPVSGFSGTKDTSLLLPSSITQRDLPKLQGTDGTVISKLLQAENTCYESFPSCISSVEILERSVVAKEARVLLDVGALMVDMSNRNVAVEWLKKLTDRTKIQAAIYFDDEDQIMSVDRDGRSAPLALSPFHRQMDRCVVYLDDVHTRGTDLKIPHGSHACVTLGRGITKDRLVQACMRMRMLGEGHSVSFWASQEVHTSITQQSSSSNYKLSTIDVLHWVIRNTVEAIKDGFRHWGSQGIAHARKKVVNQLYESNQGVDSLLELGLLSTDPEVTELVMSYGGERKETMLPMIMTSRLNSTAKDMETQIGHDAGTLVLRQGSPVTEKIRMYAGGVKCFYQVLDEEQERELEHELEEEAEKQRPGAATPRKPILSHDVRELASSGFFYPDPNGSFLPLMDVFRGTSLWELAESRGWSDKLFVTREFAMVLAPESVSTGVAFLRPVAWCAVATDSGIKRHCPIKAILHMFAPRIHREQNLMLGDRSLSLPVGGSNQAQPIPDSLIAQLIAFSGGAFFKNACEQDAYCDFLGLYPRPRSRIEDDAFQRGDIQDDGFLPPKKRQQSELMKMEGDVCAFQKSPVRFISKLLTARGWMGHASASHVGQILFIGQRAQIGNSFDDTTEATSSCGYL